MAVIVLFVTVRVLRSIVLTLTVISLIASALIAEEKAQLEQFPDWLESISNASVVVNVQAQNGTLLLFVLFKSNSLN